MSRKGNIFLDSTSFTNLHPNNHTFGLYASGVFLHKSIIRCCPGGEVTAPPLPTAGCWLAPLSRGGRWASPLPLSSTGNARPRLSQAPTPAPVALRRREGEEARRPHADWASVIFESHQPTGCRMAR